MGHALSIHSVCEATLLQNPQNGDVLRCDVLRNGSKFNASSKEM